MNKQREHVKESQLQAVSRIGEQGWELGVPQRKSPWPVSFLAASSSDCKNEYFPHMCFPEDPALHVQTQGASGWERQVQSRTGVTFRCTILGFKNIFKKKIMIRGQLNVFPSSFLSPLVVPALHTTLQSGGPGGGRWRKGPHGPFSTGPVQGPSGMMSDLEMVGWWSVDAGR